LSSDAPARSTFDALIAFALGCPHKVDQVPVSQPTASLLKAAILKMRAAMA
jgi:hypothetical protein